MPPWERVKPLVGVGVLVAAALTWVFAFRTGWASGDWSDNEWKLPSDTRGKTVYIGNKDVETTLEKEKRKAIKNKDLREEVGNMKKSLLGDHRKTRGDDIVPESPPVPEGFEYNPREACLQMKMEFPERYGGVDCMSDRYDNPDPWWKVGRDGQ
jgi:hypothetical protein